MKQKRHAGTVIAAVFLTFIVAGTVAATSRFVARSQRPKAYECKVVLRDILWAQRAYREQHGAFADRFGELKFKLEKPGRYTYFLADTLGPADVSAAQLPDLPRAPGGGADGFLAACAANLDEDPELDVWLITDAEGEPAHVASD